MCHASRPWPVSGGTGIVEEKIDLQGMGASLPSLLAGPESGPSPAVLIVHDIYGANEFYRDLARRLAGAGFLALLPDFFVRHGPLPEQTREAAMSRAKGLDQGLVLADIERALEWLGKTEHGTGKIGLVGFCMGGTLALLAAGRQPLPDSIVAYYGFPAGRAGWPYRPLDTVEGLTSPVLAFWGDQDHGVGMDNVAAYQAAVEEAGKPVETVIYPGLPHGFLTFDPNSPHYAHAQDSWNRTLEFFTERLLL
jgi:carboxymethylenebutenolidase